MKMKDPYINLANAIILQAIEDYRETDSWRSLRNIEEFFRSDWFATLSNLNGEKLIAALRKEKSYGRERISLPG